MKICEILPFQRSKKIFETICSIVGWGEYANTFHAGHGTRRTWRIRGQRKKAAKLLLASWMDSRCLFKCKENFTNMNIWGIFALFVKALFRDIGVQVFKIFKMRAPLLKLMVFCRPQCHRFSRLAASVSLMVIVSVTSEMARAGVNCGRISVPARRLSRLA